MWIERLIKHEIYIAEFIAKYFDISKQIVI